ncbi:aspartate-semialdehyde dehydrogenase [Chitinispirillales bacterium ANBcel5]|uniref:aspartate-semialdehyde dehydrogenase n=1 Tax=Cellulosispirillum alkaliphilum TaxID=3039283 RepID=UPI002A521254|nr:aspartate-semialdehyde dehydrogenase [Chitinispirillales bacterium ANBcel5]
MIRVGFIGWRGMVGSVLLERMQAEKDFNGFEPIFFSTSQVGAKGPSLGFDIPNLKDAFDIDELLKLDVIVSCQGGDYTTKTYKQLRQAGYKGFWIDAASTLRMSDSSIIVLDPVNRSVIDKGIQDGVRDFIGGNCTVSLMLMALGGLFEQDLVEWISSMTYQAASGAGAKNMTELVKQMQFLGNSGQSVFDQSRFSALELDSVITSSLRSDSMPIENFTAPLAASLLPWIDKPMENGQTREEWKGYAETNKILGRSEPIPIDGICVRIGAMRSHSQAFTIKLKKDVSAEEITSIIDNHNEWVKTIPNEKEHSLRELTPAAVSGTLSVPVGRIRKMNLGSNYISAFSVGDQLLWGAAEPIRRILKIVLQSL